MRGDPNNPQGGLLDRAAEGTAGTPLGQLLERFRSSEPRRGVDEVA